MQRTLSSRQKRETKNSPGRPTQDGGRGNRSVPQPSSSVVVIVVVVVVVCLLEHRLDSRFGVVGVRVVLEDDPPEHLGQPLFRLLRLRGEGVSEGVQVAERKSLRTNKKEQ